MRINIVPFQLGDERQFLAHGFVTTVVGTGTFNFWQNAAKRGSFLGLRIKGVTNNCVNPESRSVYARSSHSNILSGSLRRPYTAAIWKGLVTAFSLISFCKAASAAARSPCVCRTRVTA